MVIPSRVRGTLSIRGPEVSLGSRCLWLRLVEGAEDGPRTMARVDDGGADKVPEGQNKKTSLTPQ